MAKKIKVVTYVTKKFFIIIIEVKPQNKNTKFFVENPTFQKGIVRNGGVFLCGERNIMKPPLGTAPDFIVIPKRNLELAEAILRYSEKAISSKTSIAELNSIKRWAIEIEGNCNTQLKILREQASAEQ